MDVWMVAIAAGAGYIAQHWKDLLWHKKNSGDSPHASPGILKHNSLQSIHQALDKDSPSPGMMLKKKLDEDVSRARELGREDTMVEVASTSGLFVGNLGMLDYSDSCNAPSCSNSLVGSMSHNKLQGDQEGARVGGDISEVVDDLSVHPSTTEMDFSYGLARSRNSLRSRKTIRHIIKPLTSLESCLVAQLFQERAEVEEYIFGSAPLHTTTRPFLVTDGSVIISRASGDSFGMPVGTELDKLQKGIIQQEETIFGVPQLPNVGSREFQRKTRANKDQGGIFRNSSRKTNRKHHKSQGSSKGAFLLSLGISIGIFSSFLAHKKEIDKLNHILKQTDNLVQDLQDELEMKDSLTVKELATEDYGSEYARIDFSNNEVLHSLSPQQNSNKTSEYCAEEYHCQHTEEEPMSKIEAELEAELERLELNMSSTKLEGKLMELVELDPDFIPDLAEGELRDDVFDRTEPLHYADRDESSNSTPHSANYAVSPRELSLRLHEVIQSQLEERVRELETALENSQRKVRYMEVELTNSWREFSNSEAGSSSAQGSPVAQDERLTADCPDCVVMNLDGEALDAYKDAHDELSKIIELEEEEKMASGVGKIKHRENLDQIHNCRMIDENEGPDEMEKLLIEHIVDRARKGSPAVFSAQKALC